MDDLTGSFDITYGSILPTLEEEVTKAVRNNTTGGLFDISLDNFHMILSSHGGHYAEELLTAIISQIEEEHQQNVKVVRCSRNGMNVMFRQCKPSQLKEMAITLHKKIQNYGFERSLEPIHLSATVGCVSFPGMAKNALDALNKAYIARNDAKDICHHYSEYQNEEKHKVESRNQMILASYIQNAFANEKMRLAFQPIIDSRNGEVAYYECLLRIINEDGSVASAGPFIPIAEKLGFIDAIDVMVFKMAVSELVRSPELTLSVNLSNASMNDSQWLKNAVRLLSEHNVGPRLIVEITETSEARDVQNVARFVSTLQELGCRVALDDFGTGYTSFSQLKSLPVDIIKIDGSFVRDITSNPQNRFFVKTLMEFSKNFNLKSVAEFVENQETADILTSMEVDFLQGNYFSPAVQYRDWVSS